jgi:hypothetical protein
MNPLGLSLGEPEGEQVRVIEHEPQANRQAGECREFGPVLSGGNPLEGVAVDLGGVRQDEAGERCAIGVLDLDAHAACGRGGVGLQQPAAMGPKRPREASRGRLRGVRPEWRFLRP